MSRRLDTALRITGGRVETAVWTLTHPATGRTVTLVGTMHIGDPTYFRDLSGVLERLSATGAEIHVEGISRDDDDRLSDWERDLLTEADSWADAETAGAAVRLLSLESQSAELRLPPGTRNIDMSHAELLRCVGWTNYRRLFATTAGPPGPGFGSVARAAIRFQLRHGRGLEQLRSIRRRNRQVNRVVIGMRNRVAFAGGREALTRRDVVLVWGTDHLPGLARLFRAEGYRLDDEAWFEACTI